MMKHMKKLQKERWLMKVMLMALSVGEIDQLMPFLQAFVKSLNVWIQILSPVMELKLLIQ